MSEGLLDGAWKNRRVFILGGGPSLRDVDLSILAGETTLGLNWAFLHNPTANLVYDARLMGQFAGMPAWEAYQGHRFWLNYEMPELEAHSHFYGRATMLLEPRADRPSLPWPRRLDDGLYRGNNAGSAGICLADVLGADRIYLLGYDMRVEAGKPVNWHNLYPEEWRAKEDQMVSYRADLNIVSFRVRARVVNLTPMSALMAFPTDTLERVMAAKGP